MDYNQFVPLFLEFPRQEYWSELSFLSLGGIFLTQGLNLLSLAGSSLPVRDLSSVQFSTSVMSDTLRPMDCSMPGFPVHNQLPELTQIPVHWVGDAIQLSHPLSSPSYPVFNLSQHQGLFFFFFFFNFILFLNFT